MADPTPNSLLSTARPSDTSPQVQLHPLALLTISDYITRHTLRQLNGPIVGAILGQQNGREVTMEVAFECPLKTGQGSGVQLDDEWFEKRLEQYKAVYKAFEFVGWFTIGPQSGPQPLMIPIHEHLQAICNNESAILLLFHPERIAAEESAISGKLPLTLYETVFEPGSGNERAMDVEGGNAGKELKFKELQYTVETGEAEMISVDSVARGGGNATAVNSAPSKSHAQAAPSLTESTSKGKGKVKEDDAPMTGATEESVVLSPEDEELLSSLTAKSNAIKMLHRRIQLLQAYLSSLPASYLSDPSLPTSSTPPDVNHPILRSISALLARLPILAPPHAEAFARESLEEKSDVSLVALLSSITASVEAAKEAGRRYAIVESGKYQGKQTRSGMSGFEREGIFEDILNSPEGGGGGARGFLSERIGSGNRRFGPMT